MTQRARAYLNIPAAVWAIHGDSINARADVDDYQLRQPKTLRDGSVIVGARGKAIQSIPSELLQRLGSSVRSHRRMHLRLVAESLYDGNTSDELVTLAGTYDPPVDIDGWSSKLDIVRAFMRRACPALTSPKMTATSALAWAEGKSLVALQSWALSHGFWIGHIDDQADAVDAVLREELYRA